MLYQEDTIELSELFLALARHPDKPDWLEAVNLMPAEQRTEFKDWAIRVAKSEVFVIGSMGFALSKQETDALLDHCRSIGWC